MTDRKYKIAPIGCPNNCLRTAPSDMSSAWPDTQITLEACFSSQERPCVSKHELGTADLSNYMINVPVPVTVKGQSSGISHKWKVCHGSATYCSLINIDRDFHYKVAVDINLQILKNRYSHITTKGFQAMQPVHFFLCTSMLLLNLARFNGILTSSIVSFGCYYPTERHTPLFAFKVAVNEAVCKFISRYQHTQEADIPLAYK